MSEYEFSRPVEATRINTPQRIKASESECKAIAARLRLPSLTKLEAELMLKRGHGDVVLVTGELQASLSQSCVVTLEPFETEVKEAIEATYTEGDPQPLNEKLNFIDEDPDAPESIVNGKIDLGELVVQTLSLALDPYPRKPGVEFSGYDK